jgi:hypothetical protein
MPDYSKGKIYRLTCDNPELIYYGSTILLLRERLALHKSSLNCSSKKLFEVGGVEIELVLECPCDSERELKEVEQTYIENDDCCNVKNAFVSEEERIDYLREHNRSDKHRESVKQYKKSDKGKECQKKEREKRKEYMIQYRLNNIEKQKEYMKQYKLKKKIKDI